MDILQKRFSFFRGQFLFLHQTAAALLKCSFIFKTEALVEIIKFLLFA